MPVLGLVRSPSVEHGIAAAVLVTEHGGLGHTSAVYARDAGGRRRLRHGRAHRPDPGQRPDGGRRARRGLQQPDADLLARLRHLGRLHHHRERQLPAAAQHQDRLAPADAAAVVPGPVQHVLQRRRAGEPARHRVRGRGHRHRRRQRRAAASSTWCAASCAPATCTSSARSSRSPTRPTIRRGVALLDRARPDLLVAVGGGSVHRRRQGDAALPRAPRADARRPHAAVPRPAQAGGRLPAGRRTRSGWSRSRPPPAPARRSRRPRC